MTEDNKLVRLRQDNADISAMCREGAEALRFTEKELADVESERDALLSTLEAARELHQHRCDETVEIESNREEMFLADLSKVLSAPCCQQGAGATE